MQSAVTTEEAEVALAALTEQEHEVVLDAAVSSVRDDPGSFAMYDDRRQPPRHVLAKARRYDPQVFFRWNRLLHRWELWRWKGGTAECPQRAPRPHDIGRRAVFCYVIRNQDRSFRPLGEYILAWMRAGDPWRKWSHDLKEALRKIDDEDEAEDLAEDREIEEHANEFASDNKRQINEFFGRSSPIFIMSGGKSA
jgi:hypothetical protein